MSLTVVSILVAISIFAIIGITLDRTGATIVTAASFVLPMTEMLGLGSE